MEWIENVGTFLTNLADNGETVTKLLLPFYLSVIFGERILYFIFHQKYEHKDAASSIGISSLNAVFGALVGGLVQFTIFVWLIENAQLFTLPYNWWGWLVAFLIHDLIYYLDHRIAHKTGLFWAFHMVHHSSKELNFTTAARGFFLDGVLTQPLYYLMPILGMDMFQIILVVTLTNIFGILNHTRLVRNLGFLEYIFATPSNHRVHHGSNTKYLDKNYGQVLILWDIIFRSFKREEEEPTYGLTENIDTYNPIKVEMAGVQWLWDSIKSADNLSDKLRYLYKPPGWSHDGNHKTAHVLKKLDEQLT